MSAVPVLEPETLRYGLFLLNLLPGDGCEVGGGLTGATVAPGRSDVPGPVSCDGSGAVSGSRR